MTEKEFKEYEAMPDWKLFGFLSARDTSERKHVAIHLLELRRASAATKAAERSAHAAIWASVAAIASLLVTIIMSLMKLA
jgi:hypothetical protein